MSKRRDIKNKRERRVKRKLKNMPHSGKSGITSSATRVAPKDCLHTVLAHDQKASTTRKRSSRRSASGKINRFNKILDDQAFLILQRRLVKRTVYIMKNNQTIKQSTPKKMTKHVIKRRRKNRQKPKDISLYSASSMLEEGEIRSDCEKDHTIKNDEDDCIFIGPTLEEITIDDDLPSSSDVSANYQSIVTSFKERISSTPCHNRNLSMTYDAFAKNYDKKFEAGGILPFFVDIGTGCGAESINSTDNFTDYIKLSSLNERSGTKRRSVRLKKCDIDDEVIELDDNSNSETDNTLKLESRDVFDDSVVFISETNPNDFIPLVDVNTHPQKILKTTEQMPKTPVNRLRTNNLFTQSEKKKLNEYNENAYNPSASKEITIGKRTVLIDGSNVAFKHGLDQEFSVKGLKIAIEYFEKMGHEVKAVIPQFRMNKSKSTNPEELERLHKTGKIVQTPCKNLPGYMSTSYDDRFILQLAFAMDAAIVSNDNYRDLLHENPAFKKIVENRVIGYTWCNDIFILPKDPYGKWGPSLHTILNRY